MSSTFAWVGEVLTIGWAAMGRGVGFEVGAGGTVGRSVLACNRTGGGAGDASSTDFAAAIDDAGNDVESGAGSKVLNVTFNT